MSETYTILGEDGIERFEDREEWLDRIMEIHEEREMEQTAESDAMKW